ncbi:GNAT family N-acetyltransferase [Cohnella ginsengisoli]|uniref:GNAT family N-acetyltransferase n=1 Tax=Cohnella ginsengisoli TaxID=425004 RepID=A0A9X4QPP5_9BACL|nr:GNAT family N-acetyltransferase [Cohnella ginsengisoli]MDG0794584.1 GNAT family N-acetyltransferase [Cohnella ginsengisoli]
MNYRHLSQARFALDGYSVTPIRLQDMYRIKTWRNEQIDVLRQTKPLTDEDQRAYFERVVEPSFADCEPRIMLFSYFQNEALIGYGGLTNIDWGHGRAEISYLVETSRSFESDSKRYGEDFGHFLALMKSIAFDELRLYRLYTETFDIRPVHVGVLERCGFLPEGRLRGHVKIGGAHVDSLMHGCLREEKQNV